MGAPVERDAPQVSVTGTIVLLEPHQLLACAPKAIFISGYASAETHARLARGLPGSLVVRKPIGLEGLRRALADAFAGQG